MQRENRNKKVVCRSGVSLTSKKVVPCVTSGLHLTYNGGGFTPSLVIPQCRYAGYSEGNSGFTLIELLVVVLIIGILAAVAVPQYQKAVLRSRYTGLMAIVKHIRDSQEVFYLANGSYAADCEELGIDIPGNMQLNDDKQLLTRDNKSLFSCNWYGGPSVMGVLLEENQTFIMSYEHYFGENRKGLCWANKNNPLYGGVCKSFCGYIEYDSGNHPVCYF